MLARVVAYSGDRLEGSTGPPSPCANGCAHERAASEVARRKRLQTMTAALKSLMVNLQEGYF